MVDPYMSVNALLVLAADRVNKLGYCRPALKAEHDRLVQDICNLTDLVDELDALSAKPEVASMVPVA